MLCVCVCVGRGGDDWASLFIGLKRVWAVCCICVMEGNGWGRGHKGNLDEDV